MASLDEEGALEFSGARGEHATSLEMTDSLQRRGWGTHGVVGAEGGIYEEEEEEEEKEKGDIQRRLFDFYLGN
ncbi:hypothetical protein L484_010014 [Morus notabilis]|uniref:Uncharacterized protein n=1 Tax=Morus notabilis TaxID=981085 RepID=W9QN51_9ROSA|nr:hypothetical protein L484_010014 [Morus notabilis]